MSVIDEQKKGHILKMVATQEAAIDLIDALDAVKKLVYTSKPDLSLGEVLSFHGYKKGSLPYFLFNDVLKYDLNKPLNLDEVTAILEELVVLVKESAVVTVVINFHPSEAFTYSLYEKFKETLSRNFLLSFEVDTAMLGGIKVAIDGNYHDLSLDKWVSNYFSQYGI